MDKAKIKDKAEKLLEWAKEWPEFDGYLKLNALVNKDGDASLNIVVNDRIVTEYIDGSAIREYTFQFKVITPWSDGFDPINLQSEKLVASLHDWIDEQYPKNKPDWEGANITAINTLNNAPSLDFVREDDELAEWSIEAIITYEE